MLTSEKKRRAALVGPALALAAALPELRAHPPVERKVGRKQAVQPPHERLVGEEGGLRDAPRLPERPLDAEASPRGHVVARAAVPPRPAHVPAARVRLVHVPGASGRLGALARAQVQREVCLGRVAPQVGQCRVQPLQRQIRLRVFACGGQDRSHASACGYTWSSPNCGAECRRLHCPGGTMAVPRPGV